MDKHKISVSFSKEYEDLYNSLKDVSNRSNFICKILSNNFKKYDEQSDLEEIVERALIRALEKHSVNNVNYNSSDAKKDEISDED